MTGRGVACLLALGLCSIPPGSPAQEVGDAREVQVGLLLVDLTDVNAADQTMSADILMMATWQDPDLAGAEQRTLPYESVWHPVLLIYNERSVRESLPREVSVQPDGTVLYVQRYSGTFSIQMDLKDFPRDEQEFFVWVVNPQRLGSPARLKPLEDQIAYQVDRLSISDWEVGSARLDVAPFQATPDAPVNPGIKLSIPAERKVTYYMIQVLVPLVAIVMMAYTVFWIAPTVVPTRVGVVVTTMLTLIAYRFMLANHVPRLSYLTRFDWFMLGATVLVILTLFTMAGTSYLVSREREAVVSQIDRTGRWLYPVAFTIFSLAVWLT